MELSERMQGKSANKRLRLFEPEVQQLCELARIGDPDDPAFQPNPKAWAIFVLGFNHGMRASEIAGGSPETKKKAAIPPIRLNDIDFKQKMILIRRLKGSYDTQHSLVELRGNPTMSDTAALKEYLKVRIEDGSGLLFTGQKGPLDCEQAVPVLLQKAFSHASCKRS